MEASAPLPSVARKKAEAAACRRQVLGPRNVPAALLEELDQLLPMSQVAVEHFRHTSEGLLTGRQRYSGPLGLASRTAVHAQGRNHRGDDPLG
jgi:hypothetical protein